MTKLEKECHEFLDQLRDSGTVNMLEGPRALQKAAGLDPQTAKEIFLAWSQGNT